MAENKGCREARRQPGIVYPFLQSHVTFHQIIKFRILFFIHFRKAKLQYKIQGPAPWPFSPMLHFIKFTMLFFKHNTTMQGPAPWHEEERGVRNLWRDCLSQVQLISTFLHFRFLFVFFNIQVHSRSIVSVRSSRFQLNSTFLIFDFYFFLSTYKYKGHIHFRWIVSVRLRQIQETFT